jgi:hypothetical protein
MHLPNCKDIFGAAYHKLKSWIRHWPSHCQGVGISTPRCCLLAATSSSSRRPRGWIPPSHPSHLRHRRHRWIPPLVVVVVAAAAGPSSSRSRYQRCGAHHVERGVARVLAKGCSVRHDVEGGEGTKAKGRKRRRLREGRVGGDYLREASFPTNLPQVGLCGP